MRIFAIVLAVAVGTLVARTEARVRIYAWINSPAEHPTWNTRKTQVVLMHILLFLS